MIVHGKLGCGQARDRNAERRTADIVEADGPAKGDGFGVASVFATDRKGQVGIGVAPPFRPQAEQFADTVGIENVKRILGENALLDIDLHEPTGVVAAAADPAASRPAPRAVVMPARYARA